MTVGLLLKVILLDIEREKSLVQRELTRFHLPPDLLTPPDRSLLRYRSLYLGQYHILMVQVEPLKVHEPTQVQESAHVQELTKEQESAQLQEPSKLRYRSLLTYRSLLSFKRLLRYRRLLRY